MTLRAELVEGWRPKKWMLARWAWSVVVVAWMVEIIRFYYAKPTAHPGLDVATSVVVDGVYGALWFGARREARRLAVVAAKEAKEAAELRTPRAPDAGPDQCPVCGGYGLDEVAADDAFMERGERARVVPWGRKRAHRDCAELVPYVAPPHFERVEIEGHRVYCVCSKCEKATTHPGARRWCKFCGFYRWAESAEAAKAELIAHAKECPERRPTIGEFRSVATNVDALISGVETRVRRIQAEMDSYLRPNLKGRRR